MVYDVKHGVKYARIRVLTRIFPYTGKQGLEETRILAYFTP